MIIVCVECGSKIFEFLGGHKHCGDTVDPKDFKRLDDGESPQSSEAMICPKCSKPFYVGGEDGSVILCLGDQTWWPHPPINAD